jgi:hypothetical protein
MVLINCNNNAHRPPLPLIISEQEPAGERVNRHNHNALKHPAAPVGQIKTAEKDGGIKIMGYLVLQGVLTVLRFISIIEDFGFIQSMYLHPILKYGIDDGIHYFKIGWIVVLIQPKGWSQKYGIKANIAINQSVTGK